MGLEEIDKIVKETLSEKRYFHSKCTMNMCKNLAKIYGADIEEAKKVGLAHDIAKEMSNEDKIKYLEENEIEITEDEKIIPDILHAKVGADICKKQLGFSEEMAKAVAEHTTGKENMSLLSKVLYVSDSISEDREWGGRENLVKLAKNDLDEVIIYLIERMIKEKTEAGKPINKESIKAKEELMNKRKLKI